MMDVDDDYRRITFLFITVSNHGVGEKGIIGGRSFSIGKWDPGFDKISAPHPPPSPENQVLIGC